MSPWKAHCTFQESEFLNFDAMRQASQCLGRVIRSKRPLSQLLVF